MKVVTVRSGALHGLEERFWKGKAHLTGAGDNTERLRVSIVIDRLALSCTTATR